MGLMPEGGVSLDVFLFGFAVLSEPSIGVPRITWFLPWLVAVNLAVKGR